MKKDDILGLAFIGILALGVLWLGVKDIFYPQDKTLELILPENFDNYSELPTGSKEFIELQMDCMDKCNRHTGSHNGYMQCAREICMELGKNG